MFVKNCWYVAAWSSEVKEGQPLARTLLDIPIVIWRDTQGLAVALEDRCCHRGAPLSIGRIEGDSIRCMYHGLRFDTSGQCVEIPAQPRIPPGMCVRHFPIVEKHKWIWIWMGDPSSADPALLPDHHWLDDPAWRSLEGYTHYDTPYLLICDNLLDLAHLAYVHPGTLGGSEDIAKVNPKITMTDRAVQVQRWALGVPAAPFVQKVRPYDTPVDRWNHYEFALPGIFLMDSGMQPVGTGATEGRRVNAVEFRSCQALTPETEGSTHYFYCLPHNFALDQPAVTASLHQSVVTAFEEDRVMITAQARNLAHKGSGPFEMKAIRADEALGKFRWLVNKHLERERLEGVAMKAGATEAVC